MGRSRGSGSRVTPEASLQDVPAEAGSRASGPGNADVPAPHGEPPWLLKAKVLAPELPVGYVGRRPLLERFEGLLERRLTALQAPAGFGKTTVLADVARDRRDRGAVVGWVSLDDDDTPDVFGSYLAYAFELAGLDLGLLNAHDAWSSSPAVQQMGMLARAIERHDAPCLLILDEVDRLPRRTVRFVDLLVRRAPQNLHVALAFRADPGLDLARHVLGDRALVVGVDEFRFSREDIARFFGDTLSTEEVGAIEERTAGWPVALMVYRNTGPADTGTPTARVGHLTANYMGVCVLRDLSKRDRAHLLDLSVFDWIDVGVVDEVLGSSDARRRTVALPSLNGLLPPVNEDGSVRRLHPLLRDYCLGVLAVEDPARKRALHRRIAGVLARRGQLTPSWRHATAAGDRRLVGQLIERSGAFQLWQREGVTRLISAGRFLTPEIAALGPRLELLRCIILCLSSKRDEARARFDAVSANTEGFARDREGGNADALAVDGVFTRAALVGGADRLLPPELESQLPAAGPVAAIDERGRALSCARHTLLCIACYERASFEECRRHGLEAQSHLTDDMRFGDVVVNTCLGMAAMAQGQAEEAGLRYRLARQIARKSFSSDPCLTVGTDVLLIELDLEQNREKAIQRRTLKNLTDVRGIWVDVYTTALAVSAELTFTQYDSRAVIRLLTTAVDEAQVTGIDSLSKVVSALLSHYLVEVGRPEEAGQVWRERGLPVGADELLDLEGQSWRTMETLCSARIRLLAEQDDRAAAEDLASRFCATASARGLVRTLLRGLALSMVVAHRAGRPERAIAHVAEFLRAARRVGYTRPLVRYRDVSRAVLQRMLGADPDEGLRPAIESMLAEVGDTPAAAAPFFSKRELEVLAEVGNGLRNEEIADHLGLSGAGVRYHLRNIYRKTGASKRADAVRYARSLRLLPSAPGLCEDT